MVDRMQLAIQRVNKALERVNAAWNADDPDIPLPLRSRTRQPGSLDGPAGPSGRPRPIAVAAGPPSPSRPRSRPGRRPAPPRSPPKGRLGGIGNLLELPAGVPDPTIGVLEPGGDPLRRLVGLADQPLGRGEVVADALGEPPARAGHGLGTAAFEPLPRHPWFAPPTWYRSAGCSKLAGLGGRKKPPVIWIIVLLLILGASAAVSLRIEALTWRDKPAEPSLAQRWKAMGGG